VLVPGPGPGPGSPDAVGGAVWPPECMPPAGCALCVFGFERPGALPLPGRRASVPALVVPEVATLRLPWGAPMEPKACPELPSA
jgi:hypothetical protein